MMKVISVIDMQMVSKHCFVYGLYCISAVLVLSMPADIDRYLLTHRCRTHVLDDCRLLPLITQANCLANHVRGHLLYIEFRTGSFCYCTF